MKARQGRTTLVPQQTSCFHQFLSRCGMRSLETCTRNSIAKMYCSIMSPTSQKFQINQKHTHAISTAHISNRMVTFTSTLITQQPARHCSASLIAYRTLKHQHQNITSIQKFYQTTTRARILTLFLPLLGPFPLKGTTREKCTQHTQFFFLLFSFFQSHNCQLPFRTYT